MYQRPANNEQYHELAHRRETLPPVPDKLPDGTREPRKLVKATIATTDAATKLGTSPIQLIKHPALYE